MRQTYLARTHSAICFSRDEVLFEKAMWLLVAVRDVLVATVAGKEIDHMNDLRDLWSISKPASMSN